MEFGRTVDPQAFIDAYGPDAAVAFDNGMRTTLGQALAAEAMLCPADPNVRQDPQKRVGYLATRLAAAGSLRSTDYKYLPRP